MHQHKPLGLFPLLILFVLTAMAVAATATSAYAARPLPAPKLLAVYAYADWCPNCKALSPKLEEAKAKAKSDVLFVKLDLTDKARIQQSILLSSALGIAPWFQQQGSATGYVAVLDAVTKKEVARFDRESSDADIEKVLAN